MGLRHVKMLLVVVMGALVDALHRVLLLLFHAIARDVLNLLQVGACEVVCAKVVVVIF